MWSKFELHPNADRLSTATLEFDIGESPPNVGRPIKTLEFEYTPVNTRRPKMQQTGSWPGLIYVRETLIHVEFDIFADTSADFNTSKQLVQKSFSPSDPTSIVSIHDLANLVLRQDGDSEDIQASCSIDGDVTIPNSGDTGFLAQCQMTLVVAAGYFTGVTTPANIYYPK